MLSLLPYLQIYTVIVMLYNDILAHIVLHLSENSLLSADKAIQFNLKEEYQRLSHKIFSKRGYSLLFAVSIILYQQIVL